VPATLLVSVASGLGAVAWISPTLARQHAGTATVRAVPPTVAANDNRRAAGAMRGDTLFVDLDVRIGRWYPESPTGEFIEGPVLGEAGHAPQVPGPMIRVREGTVIVARLTNTLPDSTVTWYGLTTKPGTDSIKVRPGTTASLRFIAGAPGTYLYSADVGFVDRAKREREQLTAAFIVDARGARTDDRVFVMNIWSEPSDSVNGRNALAINGHAWPYTERVAATRGDTVRWRIVNGTNRVHPMHLHGFYYRIMSRGTGAQDSLFSPAQREDVVTELMPPSSTMAMNFVVNRAGNWLFHCHLAFHVNADARYAAGVSHEDHMSGDATRHMAGLVLGIEVKPGRMATRERRDHAQALRLLVQEGHRRGRAERALGFVLQEHATPALDSVNIPGTPLLLTRGRPTDITVVNHLTEPTAVHWHGIELESFSDGVAGWSGAMQRLAPTIAPGDSFTAHLTLPRAGTFIYHTHLNDVEQLTSGLYGAIVVLEPGARFDPITDHLLVVGWDGAADPTQVLVNGDSTPPPLQLKGGVHHRFRFVFIGAVNGEQFKLQSANGSATWRTLARDGYALTSAKQRTVPAEILGWAGQTYDFDFLAPASGTYRLVAGDSAKPMWSQQIVVR
jgi:FtsP/CotA-like multicopper oxidase with cupredoxin domain